MHFWPSRWRDLRWPAFLLCVLVGVLCGLGGYTFWYAEGASYFSSDPRACINCHVMREHFDGWQDEISGCRTLDDLPKAAQVYVKALEEMAGKPISAIGVGPGREQTVVVRDLV